MRYKKDSSMVILCILFFSMIALLVAIVILNLQFRTSNDWSDLLFGLMDELLSAIIIGLFIGLITKIITHQLFSIEINMSKMRDKGIYSIGQSKSSKEDEKNMFGPKRGNYPCEIKLLFLTGNMFLRRFETDVIECLYSGSKISLLLVSPQNNGEYLKRCTNRFTDGEENFVNELIQDSFVTINRIKQTTKHPENFVVRFYRDEYQNNIRITKYKYSYKNKLNADDEREFAYYWINVQPISKAALDLSIVLRGYIDSKNSLQKPNNNKDEPNRDNNLCLASEYGFDYLWKVYEGTEGIVDP